MRTYAVTNRQFSAGGGLRFYCDKGPWHLIRQINWSCAQARVSRSRVELVDGAGRSFAIEGRDLKTMRRSGIQLASFWRYALGQHRVREKFESVAGNQVGMDEFSSSLKKWMREGGRGVFPFCTQAPVNPHGAVNFGTAPGAVFWRPHLSRWIGTGLEPYFMVTTEADNYVCYAIHPETHDVLGNQYIDPRNGLPYSYRGGFAEPLVREYAAEVNANHRTYFGKIPILWPIKTLKGHIGRWATGVNGDEFLEFSTRVSYNVPFREIFSDMPGEDAVVAVLIGGEPGGGSPGRYRGIKGRISLPVMSLGAKAGRCGVVFARKEALLPAALVRSQGIAPGQEVEVAINDGRIMRISAGGEDSNSKLVSHFDPKEQKWVMTKAERKFVPPEHFHGAVMVEGLIVSLRSTTPLSLSFKAGGNKLYYLCSLRARVTDYPRHACAIFWNDRLVFFRLGSRFADEDQELLIQIGKALTRLNGDVKPMKRNKELERRVAAAEELIAAAKKPGADRPRLLKLAQERLLATFKHHPTDLSVLERALWVAKKVLREKFSPAPRPLAEEDTSTAPWTLAEAPLRGQQLADEYSKADGRKWYLPRLLAIKREVDANWEVISRYYRRSRDGRVYITLEAIHDWNPDEDRV